MRKDVKLGLAVGGVLLAVLVVYVLVAPGTNQPGAELAVADSETAAGAGDAASGAGAGDSSVASNANAQGGDVSPDGAARNASGAANDARANSTGGAGSASAGASGANNGGANNGGAAGGGNAGGAASTAGGGEKATADGGGWNWDALVNGDAKVPPLMTSTEVPQNTAAANPTAGAIASNDAASGATGTNNASADATIGAGQLAQGPTANPLLTVAPNDSSPSARPATPEASAGPAATPAAGAAGGTHVVKSGETFSSIAASTYGNAKYYLAIAAANPTVDPTRLKPGMSITLPPADQVKVASSAAAASSASGTATAAPAELKIDPRTQYKVQPNDSLYRISLKLYGKADRVEKLYEANKSLIGEDMAQVKAGTVLTLPEPPTQSTEAATAR